MFCFCWPVESFFLCPLFIIYIRTSIVIRCRGNLLHKTLLLTRTPGGKTYFHCSRQDCVHTHTHIHTNLSQKCTPPTQYCPPPPVTTTQARFRDTNRQDTVCPPLYKRCIHLFLCLIFFFYLLFSVFFSQFSACNVRSRSPHPSESL